MGSGLMLGFRRGEIQDIPKDAIVFEALVDFWLAPFAHLRVGDTFRWSPTTQHAYYTPCGYDPSSDVEAAFSKHGIENNDGFFQQKVPPSEAPTKNPQC